MVNMVDFQNTPQNGDTGHDNDKHLAGGQRCSRFVPVHGLFLVCSKVEEQNVNKGGTMVFTVCSSIALDNACTYTRQCVYLHWYNACTCIQYCVHLHIVPRLLHIGIIPGCACGCKVDIVSYENITLPK